MCFPRVISCPTSSFLGCPNHNLKFIRFILFSNCECEDGVAEVLAAGTREFSECFSQGPWPTCPASSRPHAALDFPTTQIVPESNQEFSKSSLATNQSDSAIWKTSLVFPSLTSEELGGKCQLFQEEISRPAKGKLPNLQ